MRKPQWTSSRNVKKSCEPSQWGFPFFSDAYWCSMSIVLRRRNESCNTFFIMLIVRYLLNSLPLSVEINLQLLTHVSNKTKTETFSRSSRQLHWCTLHTDPPNSKSGDCVVIIFNFCTRSSDGGGGGGGSRCPMGCPENFLFASDIRDTSEFTICNSNLPSWKQNSLIHPLI